MDGMNVDLQKLNQFGFSEVQFGSDNNVNVSFYVKSVLNRAKSREEGRPVHESIEYVRIQHPGEKDYTDRPVTEVPQTVHRFARQWAAFKESRKFVPDGTPVEMVFPQWPEIAANLHGLGVHTAEQLANLTAEGISHLGLGGQDWVNKAKKFVEYGEKGVAHHKVQKELSDRDSKIDVLENTVAMMKNQIDRLLAAQSGVPLPMLPPDRANQAQAWAQTVEPPVAKPLEVDLGPEETGADPTFPNAIDLGSAEFQAPAAEPGATQPKRRGRPPKSVAA